MLCVCVCCNNAKWFAAVIYAEDTLEISPIYICTLICAPQKGLFLYLPLQCYK